MSAVLEKKYTDKEFCEHWRIDRATSLRWREQGVVGYIKLPNGSIRYSAKHMQELEEKYEKDTKETRSASRKVQVNNVRAIR